MADALGGAILGSALTTLPQWREGVFNAGKRTASCDIGRRHGPVSSHAGQSSIGARDEPD